MTLRKLREALGLTKKCVERSEGKWTTVRIAPELISSLEDLVENGRDEFGLPLFGSKSDAVTQALKEFFLKLREAGHELERERQS